MIEWLRDVLLGKKHRSLDSVRFDTSGYQFRGEPEPGGLRMWYTEKRDSAGIYYFDVPPDLPHVSSIAQLHSHYMNMLSSGGRIVDLHVGRLKGCAALANIVAIPQQPTGLTYIATWTLPFRDFSYVFKIFCQERGITGMREAVLMDREFANRSTDDFTHQFAESAEFDAEFPDHPLSRARQFLSRVEHTVIIGDIVRKSAPFALPRSGPASPA